MLLYCDPLGLKQNMDVIEEFLQKYLQDAKPEVRQIARLCFLAYKQLVLPSRSCKLQRSLTASNQRALEEINVEALTQMLQQFKADELERVNSLRSKQAPLPTHGTLGPTSLNPSAQKNHAIIKQGGRAGVGKQNSTAIPDFSTAQCQVKASKAAVGYSTTT